MRSRVSTDRSAVATLLSLLVMLGSRSPRPLLAQSTPAGKPTDTTASAPANAPRVGTAAPPIAVADVARDLAVFATDSLRRRETPSAGLTAAAAYVAAEFQRLGLSPEVQTYPIPGQQRVDAAASKLYLGILLKRNGKSVVAEDGQSDVMRTAELSFQTDVYFAPEVGPQTVRMKRIQGVALLYAGVLPDSLTLLAGPYTPASVRQLADTLWNKTVLYVPPSDVDTVVRRQVIAALYAVARGVVVVGSSDSGRFAAARARAPEATFADEYLRVRRQEQSPWAVVASGARVGDVLAAVGEDLEHLRAGATPVLRPLALQFTTAIQGKAATDDVLHAPNVIGTLPGSDSTVRDDYVVIVAPLDSRRRDDRAAVPAEHVDADVSDANSAAAGLLALARAFTQPGRQPRRSIVFLAASGGNGNEFWGANYFVTGWKGSRRRSVALALDRLGHWPGDSAVVHGLHDIEMVPALSWIVGNHPEVDLRVVDGGTATQPLADHFAFVRATIPSLYVHPAGEAHPAAGAASAGAEAEQAVRGTRLVFYLAQALANASQRPRWSTEGNQYLRMVLDP